MKIASAEFVKSAFNKSHWLDDGRPEIAFLGRSNVGKSSLINSLLGRRGLARTSNTPGRTQSVNFFLISAKNPVAIAPGSDKGGFYFADLPGYGYARVSKSTREDWGKMAEEYLAERRELALCVQLIDVRHEPTTLDRQLNEWLSFHGKPHVIVATKADKLSKNELRRSLKTIESILTNTKIIAFSSKSNTGHDELWANIRSAIENF